MLAELEGNLLGKSIVYALGAAWLLMMVRFLAALVNGWSHRQETKEQIFREHAELTLEKKKREFKEREDLSKVVGRNELGQFLPKNKK